MILLRIVLQETAHPFSVILVYLFGEIASGFEDTQHQWRKIKVVYLQCCNEYQYIWLAVRKFVWQASKFHIEIHIASEFLQFINTVLLTCLQWKVTKTCTNFAMSIHMSQFENCKANYSENSCLGSLLNFVGAFQFWLVSYKNNRYCLKTFIPFWYHLEQNLLSMFASYL